MDKTLARRRLAHLITNVQRCRHQPQCTCALRCLHTDGTLHAIKLRQHPIRRPLCLPNLSVRSHARSQNFELLDSSYLSVRPSVRMEQFGSHWKKLREILYLRIFRKLCKKKNQVSLKSDKNKSYFTRRPTHIFDHISVSSS